MGCLFALLAAACSGPAKVDHDQASASADTTTTAGAAEATESPKEAPAATTDADATQTEQAKVSPRVSDLSATLDGEIVEMKRAFAYQDGANILLLVTNKEDMACGTFFDPSGRVIKPDERTFLVWLAPVPPGNGGTAWSIFSVMINSQSKSGDDLGEVRSQSGTANDLVQVDLSFKVDTGIPQANIEGLKLEVAGALVAEGCGDRTPPP